MFFLFQLFHYTKFFSTSTCTEIFLYRKTVRYARLRNDEPVIRLFRREEDESLNGWNDIDLIKIYRFETYREIFLKMTQI